MGNNYIAGVIAAGYYFAESLNCKRLNLPSMRQYVNAGVLLMNLKQIRKNDKTIVFCVDQEHAAWMRDAINEFKEVKDNDYNISVNSYLKTGDDGAAIDIAEVNKKLAEVVPKQQQIRKELEEIIKELEVDYHE